MTDYVIVGAGASGLFTAWRLLDSGKIGPGDSVRLYEWSDAHVGGRIHTYDFPLGSGQYIEAGGMRFATDVVDGRIVGGHVLLQNLIHDLGLDPLVVDFVESPDRLYYLRGENIWESEIPKSGSTLPYHFNLFCLNQGFDKQTADDILAAVASTFAPGSSNWTRAQWCDYFANGTLQSDLGGVFSAGTNIGDIGYWNLLYAYLGDEGFDYVSDANGYQSNVINWNSADAMQANADFGSTVKYKRIAGGYGKVFDALRDAIGARDPDCIQMKCRLMLYGTNPNNGRFACNFLRVDSGEQFQVECDYLFLAMPRRSLEMVAANCGADNPLNDPAVQNYLQSSIDQPAMRIGMLFEEAWWTNPAIVQYVPDTTDAMGGPSITDLPLRQVFYFGNNAIDAGNGGPYVMLASYDDMTYASFWRELEIEGRRTTAPSLDYQALNGPTTLKPGSTMEKMVLSQLGTLHGLQPGKNIPAPLTTIYMDWGTDPFGGGYHGWAAHYDICEVMGKIRAPSTEILGRPQNLFIIGSCYSIDQAWVEGALCVAESVLQDYLKLPPFCAVPPGYVLIC